MTYITIAEDGGVSIFPFKDIVGMYIIDTNKEEDKIPMGKLHIYIRGYKNYFYFRDTAEKLTSYITEWQNWMNANLDQGE